MPETKSFETVSANVAKVREQMREAAADLEFEKAARIKKRLDVISGLQDKQQVVLASHVNVDFVGVYREETISAACVFAAQKLLGKRWKWVLGV